jgi:hypothetical protein
VAKSCPSCGYRFIGPFIDNCPICAEPVRNVRSDGPGLGWPASWQAWLRWVLIGTAALVLTVAGCCGLGMWRLGSAVQDAQKALLQQQEAFEADRKARTMVIASADLLQEFQMDAAAADRKCKGKILEVSGIVERTGKGGNSAFFAILHGGDEKAQLKIECFFDFVDEDDEARNNRLGKGQTVTVRGDYAGRVTHLQLRSCVLVK